MLKGLTLQDLAKTLEEQKLAKKDYIGSTRMMYAFADTPRAMSLEIKGTGTFSVSDICNRQIADKLGIPYKYYERMLFENPELLLENVNSWLWKDPVRRMVRTLGPTARAFLSDRYQRLDNTDLAEAVLPTLFEHKAEICSAQITDSRMYIQASLPSLTREIKVGDPVEFGIVISNSEVGMGKARVEPFAKILQCLNGMIFETAIQKTHLGRQLIGDSTWELLTDETKNLTDQAFWNQLKDVVAASFSPAYFETVLTQLKKSAGQEIKVGLDEVIDVTAKSFGLGEEEKDSVLKNLIKGQDLSRWGLANAVNRVGHTTESYDRCIELERMSGKIVTEDAVWIEVNKSSVKIEQDPAAGKIY